jgi:hypothetical protein
LKAPLSIPETCALIALKRYEKPPAGFFAEFILEFNRNSPGNTVPLCKVTPVCKNKDLPN